MPRPKNMQPLRQFSQYDVVKLKTLPSSRVDASDPFNRRSPRVGDVATIIEVYETPPGYELECSGEGGITEWMLAFSPEEADFELLASA